jgi:hypothetical protein
VGCAPACSGGPRRQQGAERVESGVHVEFRIEQRLQQQPAADRAEQRGDRVGGAPVKIMPRS